MDNKTEQQSSKQLAIMLARVIAVLLFSDLFVGPMFDAGPDRTSRLLFGFVFGLCAGQFNLISIWAAISRGPLVARLPWAYLLLFFVWAAITIGNTIMGANNVQDTFSLGIVLLVCCTVAQVPLWIASRVMGWQLCRNWEVDESMQFNIGHLLLGTTFLAISMTIARGLLVGSTTDLVWTLDWNLQVALCVLTIANLFMVVPFIWVSFYRSLSSILFVPLVAAVFAIVEILVFTAILGPGGSSIDLFLLMITFNCSQILVVLFVLSLLKRHGFRLVRNQTHRKLSAIDL